MLLGVEKMARSGRDPAQFARDLLAHLRHLLVTQTVGEVPDDLRRHRDRRGSPRRPGGGDRRRDPGAHDRRAGRGADRRPRGRRRAARRRDRAAEGGAAGSRSVGRGAAAARREARARTRVAGPRVLPAPGTCRPRGRSSLLSAPPPAEPRQHRRTADRLRRRQPPEAKRGAAPAPPVPDGSAARQSRPRRRRDPEPAEPAPSEAAEPAGHRGLSRRSAGPSTKIASSGRRSSRSCGRRRRPWRRPSRAPGRSSLRRGALTVGFPAELTFNKRKAEAPDKREQVTDGARGRRSAPSCARVYVLLEARRPPRRGAGGAARLDHEALVEKLKSEFNAEEVG